MYMYANIHTEDPKQDTYHDSTDEPAQVPNRLRHTLPFSYRFGFNLSPCA